MSLYAFTCAPKSEMGRLLDVEGLDLDDYFDGYEKEEDFEEKENNKRGSKGSGSGKRNGDR